MIRRLIWCLPIVALAVAGLTGCGRADAPPPGESSAGRRPLVVAGTAMIECAVRELAGESVRVHRLAPPGQCPGHFDLKPADFRAIREADMLLRHDYQSHYDGKLRPTDGAGQIVELPTTGPQTLPQNYVRLCEDLAERLAEAYPSLAGRLQERLRQIRSGQEQLARDVEGMAAPLSGRPVIASSFQVAFCRWLGCRVVGEFDLADEMSIRQLAELVAAGRQEGAVAVVANLQRGDREGRPIADRLGVPLVLLSNFPLEPGSPGAHARMVRANVLSMLEACVE